jgi:predicted secreted Zn-dependent protease
MNDKIYIMKELVGDFEHSDLDFDLSSQFGFNDEINSDLVVLTRGSGSADGYSINIDRMIETLNELKSRGATHVELNYHEDHIGYQISGYKIDHAEPALVEAYEVERLIKSEKAKEIAELKKKLRELENPTVDCEDEDLPF